MYRVFDVTLERRRNGNGKREFDGTLPKNKFVCSL